MADDQDQGGVPNEGANKTFGTQEFSKTAPPGSVQAPPRTSGVNEDVDKINRAVNALSANFDKFLGNFDDFISRMEKLPKLTDETNRRLDRGVVDLKSMVQSTDDLQEQFKAILEYNKKMSNSGILNAKNQKDLLRTIGELRNESEALLNRGFFSTQKQKVLKTQIEALADAFKMVEQAGEEAVNEDNMTRLTAHLRRASHATNDLLQNFRKLERSKLSKDARNIFDAVGTAGIHTRPGKTDKYVKLAQAAYNVKQVAEARKQGNLSEFIRRRDRLGQNLQQAGVNLNLPFKNDGSIDFRKLAAMKKSGKSKADLQKMDFTPLASSLAGREGGGVLKGLDAKLGNYFLKKIAMNQAQGGEMGLASKLGMNLLAKGEGSVTRGIGSWGLGLAESGASGIGSIAGRFAPVLAIGEVLRETFDKVTTLNKEVEKSLGAGGVFTNNMGGFENFTKVRSNLLPQGLGNNFYNRYGINYKKNLEIAKGMVDQGFSVSELTGKSSPYSLRSGDQGFGPGGYGLVQQQVYSTARLAGFDTPAAVENIIKLITKYNQSLDSTDEFFIHLAKDSKAAGMSTLKYIQTIDEITNSFDRMNKSFSDTVSTMKILSRTGRASSEDLKAYMDTLLNNRQQQDVSLRAYLTQSAFGNPGLRGAIGAGHEANVTNAQQQVVSALKTMGFSDEELGKMDLNSNKGIQYATALVEQKAGGSPDIRSQSAGSALRQLDQALTKRNMFNQAVRTNNYVGYATGMDITGQNMTDRITYQGAALSRLLQLKGGNLGDLFDDQKRAAFNNSPLSSFASQALGMKPEDLRNFIDILQSAGNAILKLSQEGRLQNADMLFDKIASNKKSGLVLGNAPNKTAALKDYANTDAGMKFLSQNLPTLETTFFQLIQTNSEVKKLLEGGTSEAEKLAAREKAKELNVATRSTGDIFADAFDHLFQMIARPLEYIAGLMQSKFGQAAQPTKQTSEDYTRAKAESDKAFVKMQSELERAGQYDDVRNKQYVKELKQRMEVVQRVQGGGDLTTDAEQRNFIDIINGALGHNTGLQATYRKQAGITDPNTIRDWLNEGTLGQYNLGHGEYKAGIIAEAIKLLDPDSMVDAKGRMILSDSTSKNSDLMARITNLTKDVGDASVSKDQNHTYVNITNNTPGFSYQMYGIPIAPNDAQENVRQMKPTGAK
jgi:hypothetical protein